ncbi:MAG: short-chain dehydrogenase, partial [Gemmatimonadales bacterium]
GMSEELLQGAFLYQILDRYRPAAVVDCINTATAFAYKNVFESARNLLAAARDASVTEELVERHVLTIAMPQLIRHIQILLESLKRSGVQAYVKIGTSGTGGMGFNIPYTHSEEKPSRTLLTKSAVAGAQTLLLFLMARTPGGPAVTEVKPTATIGWREIAYGPVMREGQAMQRYDCPEPVSVMEAFAAKPVWREVGEPLESVYANMGENGVFARQEFETVTSLGSMELITPEEVAEYVVMQLQGRPTGRDVIAALDSATAGPTYRAGIMRDAAIKRLAELEGEHGVDSVAFEMLGPPRLTKLLYESFMVGRIRGSVEELARSDAANLAAEAADWVARSEPTRSAIISVGLPIVIEGEKIYRGPRVMIPPDGGDIDTVASRGWVDLRRANMAAWIARAVRVTEQAATRDASHRSGSDVDWGAMNPEDVIVPSRFTTWIFRHEDDGERIKR